MVWPGDIEHHLRGSHYISFFFFFPLHTMAILCGVSGGVKYGVFLALRLDIARIRVGTLFWGISFEHFMYSLSATLLNLYFCKWPDLFVSFYERAFSW